VPNMAVLKQYLTGLLDP